MKETVRVTKWVAGGIEALICRNSSNRCKYNNRISMGTISGYASIPYCKFSIIKKGGLAYNR